MALENPATPRLQLTTRAETTASAAQVDSQWLFFEATNYLTPPDIFDKIGAAIGARIVQKSSTSCVYAVPRGRVCELAGKTYAGWVALTTQRHG
jgi:hypothetical protein